MDVKLQTRAVTGQNVGETILETLIEEGADQVLLGWQGSLTRDEAVFGPNLDPVVEQAPCEVSLVTLHNERIGSPVALAGPGPHAPVAARRAVEFATVDDTVPTLLNVQSSTAGSNPVARGEETITDIAERISHQATGNVGIVRGPSDSTSTNTEPVETIESRRIRRLIPPV